jgi:hypothetical protein
MNCDCKRAVTAGASGEIQTQDPRHRPDSLPTVENCHYLSDFILERCFLLSLPIREEANIMWHTVILTTLIGFHTCVTACFVTGKRTSISYPNNLLSRNLTEAIKLLACIRGLASFESGPAHPTSLKFVVFLSQPRKLRDRT